MRLDVEEQIAYLPLQESLHLHILPTRVVNQILQSYERPAHKARRYTDVHHYS